MRQKLKLLLSYDGTDFGGWQRQKGGRPTIQGTLEQALSRLFDEPIKICGAGRTDAGVHAIGQVAHCWVSKDPTKYTSLLRALNGLTPSSIAIRGAWLAPQDFHAIASARFKVYKYLIHNASIPTALRARYTWWVQTPLDIKKLNAYSKILVKKQDFKSFQTAGTNPPNTVREVFKAEWKRLSPHLVEFTIVGDGFLKQMVRNIVGTQMYLFQNDRPVSDMAEILAAKDRQKAKATAPPQGLYLCSVHYPHSLDNKCRKI